MAFITLNIEELNNSGLSGQISVNDDIQEADEWVYGQYSFIKNYEQYKEFYKSILIDPAIIFKLKLRSNNFTQVDNEIKINKKNILGQEESVRFQPSVFNQSKFPYSEINKEIAINNKESFSIFLEQNSRLNISLDYIQMDRREDFNALNNNELCLSSNIVRKISEEKKETFCEIIKKWIKKTF